MPHRHARAGPDRRARTAVLVLATLVTSLLAATMVAAPRADALVPDAPPPDLDGFTLAPDAGGG